MNYSAFISVCCLFPLLAQAQLSVDQSLTPAQIVEDHLLGEGVDVWNLTVNGGSPDAANPQLGVFSGGWEAIGITQGIILATGDASVAEGPNDLPTAYIPIDDELTEEPDLQQLVSTSAELNDVAVLEFDFVASGDTLRFSYVFASEEYNEHTCSPYNDAFGFFISGPGMEGNPDFENGALNVAKIPGTDTPVAINTVNKGVAGEYGSMAICNAADINWQSNSNYFVDNEANDDLNTTQFDGFTKVFHVEIPVVCGGTYHIKMAIADAVDGKNDSAVFIESESFASEPPLEVEPEVVEPSSDGLAVEGCSSYNFKLTRSDSIHSKVVFLQSDFIDSHPEIFPDFPDSLVFYPAQGHVEWELPIQNNNVFEGLRNFDISFLQPATCGLDTAVTDINLSLSDVAPMEVMYPDTVFFSCDENAAVSVGITGGLEPYSILWEGEEEGFEFDVQTTEPLELRANVSDQCGIHSEELTIWIIPEDYDPLEIVLPEELEFNCINPITLNPVVTGGRGDYSYAWRFQGELISTQSDFSEIIVQEGILEFSVTDGCMGMQTAEIDLTLMENPIEVELGDDREGFCDQEMVFFPEVSGGFGSFDFLWTRNFNPVSTSSTYAFVPEGFSVVSLRVTDQCGQVKSDTVFVQVDIPPLELSLVSDTAICKGERLELVPLVSGGYGEYSYFWKERESNASVLSIIPSRDVTYSLEVKDDCNQLAEATVNIDVVEVIAEFEFNYEDDQRPIRNLSGTGLSYFWVLPDGTTSTAFEPVYVPVVGSNEIVLLEVTHPSGCSDEFFDFYKPPLNLFIPNAFTPDGDGLNDVFTAKGTFIKEYDLWIFNRWGNLVFHSKNPEHGWDGSDPSDEFSGQTLIYSYRVRARGHDGEVIDRKGTVQVLR